jgi:signal peptidase I
MRKIFKFVVWVAFLGGALVGVLRLTFIRWWRVPSNDPYLTASISPTLRGGDLILLWRGSKPGFGDLVLCPEPKRTERVVIGRLVGEGNDEIKVSGSTITLNGRRQISIGNCAERTFVESDPETRIEVEQYCDLEELGGGTHQRGNAEPHPLRAPEVSTKVPPGHVWLVSDNRLYPYDSRDFGAVDRDTCKETVFFRLVGGKGFFDVERRNQFIH